MTIQIKRTVPSEFTRLDDTITDPDAFKNVRDEQVLRENHNILVARGIRKPVWTHHFSDDTNLADPLLVMSLSPTAADRSSGYVVTQVPLAVNPLAQKLEVVLRASIESNSVNCALYGVFDTTRERPQIDTTNAVATLSSTTEGTHTLVVPCPMDLVRSDGLGILSIYAETPTYGAALKASTAITAAGPDWVEGAFTSTFDERVIYIDTDPLIRPQIVRSSRSLGGGSYRMYTEFPWNKIPTPGTDTAVIIAINKIKLYAGVVYEQEITNFEAERTLA